MPDTLTAADIADRRSFLQAVDRGFRQKEKHAEFGRMDRFTNQALTMLLSPSVKQAFDLSQESDRTKEAYGPQPGRSKRAAGSPPGGGGLPLCDHLRIRSRGLGHPPGQRPEAAGQAGPPPWTQTLSVLLEDLQQRGLLDSNRGAGPWASSVAPPT